jgi:hypothetical protein
MAGRDGALARPDVPVFPQEAEVHLGLRHLPCLGVADSRRDAENLLDAGRDAVRPVCLDKADVRPEARHLDLMAWVFGKLAVREPRPADAALGRLDLASAWFPERLASADDFAERLVQPRAAAERYTQAAGPFAA